jgi:hypothetical protein
VHVEDPQLPLGQVPEGVHDSGRDGDPRSGAGADDFVPQREFRLAFKNVEGVDVVSVVQESVGCGKFRRWWAAVPAAPELEEVEKPVENVRDELREDARAVVERLAAVSRVDCYAVATARVSV